MKKDLDIAHMEYTGDAVIGRGYAIYDEWESKRLASVKIVARVEKAIAVLKDKKTKAASVEALAFLFALDLRIKEKYYNIFRCIFSYFSWRRETNALKLLKGTLRIPYDVDDVRTAIEVELKRIRERIGDDEAEDDDDETHGGRQNGKSDEEAIESKENQDKEAAEDNAEKSADADEKREDKQETPEKSEEIDKKSPDKKQSENIQETQEKAEKPQKEKDIAADDTKEISNQSEQAQNEVENNGSDEISGPNTDRPKEAKTNNDVIDYPPLYDEALDEKDEKLSFIDEVIMDNMVKGKKDIIWHNPLDDVGRSADADIAVDSEARGNEESRDPDKDAHLYDEILRARQDDAHQQAENTPVQKQEQENVQVQSTDQAAMQAQSTDSKASVESLRQGFESIRVPLQVDITNDMENQMRVEINNSIIDSPEAVAEHIRLQEDAMREQLDILSAEFLMDAPVDVIEKNEAPHTETSISVHNRK